MSGKKFEKNKSEIRKISGGAGKRTKKRRRSNAGRIALVMTVLTVSLVGVVLSLTVFFKTKAIDVYGESRYSSKEIIKAGNIELESNLIRLDSKKISDRIETKLPYIEKVVLQKKLPTTVILNVTEATVAGYVKTKEGYSILSTNGKVLEKTEKQPQKMAEILGIDAQGVKVAEYVSDENGTLSSAKAIYNALGVGMSSGVTEMNVGDRINLSFVYRDRVTVLLGSETDLEKKIGFVSKILNDPKEVSEDDIGIIYASNAKRISFLRKGSYTEYLEQLEDEKKQNESSDIAQTETEENTKNTASDDNLSSSGTSSEN